MESPHNSQKQTCVCVCVCLFVCVCVRACAHSCWVAQKKLSHWLIQFFGFACVSDCYSTKKIKKIKTHCVIDSFSALFVGMFISLYVCVCVCVCECFPRWECCRLTPSFMCMYDLHCVGFIDFYRKNKNIFFNFSISHSFSVGAHFWVRMTN